MSYEILLYPRTPGQDWGEVLEADEADGPEMDLVTLNQGVARFRRIEAALREQLTEQVRTWVPEGLDGDILGEFQTRDSGLRVDLYDRSASVSAPAGDPATPVHDLVRRAVEIVAAETGYEAYDPRAGATWDGSFDAAAAQASPPAATDRDDLWAEGAGTAPGGTPSDEVSETPLEGPVVDGEEPEGTEDPRAARARLMQERREQLLEQRRQPAALRRRAWFNVVFGVIAIGIGLMRQSAGQTDFLTWMFLGLGVFELFSAWFLFSQARQAAEQEQQSPDADQAPGTPHDDPDGTTPR